MSNLRRKLRNFIKLFTPGGTVRTESGVEMHISSNGTSTVSGTELQKVIFKRFNEMAPRAANAESKPE